MLLFFFRSLTRRVPSNHNEFLFFFFYSQEAFPSQSRLTYYSLAQIIETIEPHAVAGADEPASPLQQNRWTETSVARGKGGLQNFINFCSCTVSLWMSELSVREYKEKMISSNSLDRNPPGLGFINIVLQLAYLCFSFPFN